MRSRSLLLFTAILVLAVGVSARAQDSSSSSTLISPTLLAAADTSSPTATAVPGSAARVDFDALANGGQTSMPATINERGRSEFTLQYGGWFTNGQNNNNIRYDATNASVLSAAYRYHFTPWMAAEGVFDYTRFTNNYNNAGVPFAVQSNVYGITGNAVFSMPGESKVKPFGLIGGGVLMFHPTNNAGGTVPGNVTQTKGTFDFGAGLDYYVNDHFAIRGEYRAFVYHVPSFKVSALDMNKLTIASVPSVGISFRF